MTISLPVRTSSITHDGPAADVSFRTERKYGARNGAGLYETCAPHLPIRHEQGSLTGFPAGSPARWLSFPRRFDYPNCEARVTRRAQVGRALVRITGRSELQHRRDLGGDRERFSRVRHVHHRVREGRYEHEILQANGGSAAICVKTDPSDPSAKIPPRSQLALIAPLGAQDVRGVV